MDRYATRFETNGPPSDQDRFRPCDKIGAIVLNELSLLVQGKRAGCDDSNGCTEALLVLNGLVWRDGCMHTGQLQRSLPDVRMRDC